MVLEGALNELVENIWCDEFIYISTGEIVGEWLEYDVCAEYKHDGEKMNSQ